MVFCRILLLGTKSGKLYIFNQTLDLICKRRLSVDKICSIWDGKLTCTKSGNKKEKYLCCAYLFSAGDGTLFGCDSKSRIVSFKVCGMEQCPCLEQGHPPDESVLEVDGSLFHRVSAVHVHPSRLVDIFCTEKRLVCKANTNLKFLWPFWVALASSA